LTPHELLSPKPLFAVASSMQAPLGPHERSVFLPILERMASRIPNLACGILCSPDGMQLCSVMASHEQAAKLAALCGSLISICDATVNVLVQDGLSDAGVVTTESGSLQLVGLKVRCTDMDLLLLAAAKASLGVVLVGARTAAAELSAMPAPKVQ